MEPQEVKIYDARELQAQAESKAAFFQEHGFVLLDSKTEVTEWNSDYTKVGS